MEVVYKNKNIDLEIEAFDDIGSLIKDSKECFDVDQIYDDIINGYRELPKKLQDYRMMLYTYWGDLTSMYSLFNRSRFLKFNNREFFRISPNELIDENPDIESDSPIYLKLDYNKFNDFNKMITSYIEHELEYDNIRLIGPNDDYYGYCGYPRDGGEYLLNSWAYSEIKPNYGMVEKKILTPEVRSLMTDHESKYVPGFGPASTKYGELLRACQRVVYRYFNDGDMCIHIMDGNIISYLSIPELMDDWIDKNSDEFKFFVEEFNKVIGIPFGWDKSVYYEPCDGDDAVILTIGTEIALIRTREKYPEFLNTENTIDSRYWQNWD